MATPSDAKKRKEIRPVICYPNNTLPDPDLSGLNTRRKGSSLIKRIIIPPRQGICLPVMSGQLFRIISSEGPQVGDLPVKLVLLGSLILDLGIGIYYNLQ